MEDFASFFFVLICFTIFYTYLQNKSSEVTYVNYNNVEYLVRNLPDKEEAALLLSKIRNRLQKIVDSCVKKSGKENNSYNKQNIEDINRMKKNFRPDNITESSPNNKYTSYSVNKGQKIVFCIRSKENNTLVDCTVYGSAPNSRIINLCLDTYTNIEWANGCRMFSDKIIEECDVDVALFNYKYFYDSKITDDTIVLHDIEDTRLISWAFDEEDKKRENW